MDPRVGFVGFPHVTDVHYFPGHGPRRNYELRPSAHTHTHQAKLTVTENSLNCLRHSSLDSGARKWVSARDVLVQQAARWQVVEGRMAEQTTSSRHVLLSTALPNPTTPAPPDTHGFAMWASICHALSRSPVLMFCCCNPLSLFPPSRPPPPRSSHPVALARNSVERCLRWWRSNLSRDFRSHGRRRFHMDAERQGVP